MGIILFLTYINSNIVQTQTPRGLLLREDEPPSCQSYIDIVDKATVAKSLAQQNYGKL